VAPCLGIRVLKLGETQKGDPWKRSDPLTIYAHKMLFSQRLKKTTTKNKKNFIQSRKRATGLLLLFFFFAVCTVEITGKCFADIISSNIYIPFKIVF